MTQIPYIEKAWNVVVGCSRNGCKAECWAEVLHRRRHKATLAGKKMPAQYAKPFNRVQILEHKVEEPIHWRKPRRVGVCFTGELFDDQTNLFDILKVFGVMAKADRHTFFTLTKQPARMLEFFEWCSNYQYGLYQCESGKGHVFTNPLFHVLNSVCWDEGELYDLVEDRKWPLPNVYLGVSICDQEDADRMIPDLLRIPGRHWVSIEPILTPVDLDKVFSKHCLHWEDISWLIIGCESGPRRRPCKIEWMINIVQQCKDAGVPLFVKQVDLGDRISREPSEWPGELRVQEFPIASLRKGNQVRGAANQRELNKVEERR